MSHIEHIGKTFKKLKIFSVPYVHVVAKMIFYESVKYESYSVFSANSVVNPF